MNNASANWTASTERTDRVRYLRVSRSLLVLIVAAALGAEACSSDDPPSGPCSQHDECARGSYCVQSQCVSACSSDDECEAPLSCRPHPDLPSDASGCFVTVGDGDDTSVPLGGRDGAGGTDGSGGTDDTGGADGAGATGGRPNEDGSGGTATDATGGLAQTGGMPGSGGWSGGDPSECDPIGLGGFGGQGGAGSAGVQGPDSVFVEGGLGTSGPWQGYLYAFSAPDSEVFPECFSTDQVCVQGTLAAGYTEWVNVGWNIAQDVDPETFEGGAVRAISPGGDGIVVDTENFAGSGLRVQIQTDPSASEFWCAAVPSGGGVLQWEDFRKECWIPGGEQYDGVTPISQIVVQSYASSDSLPTPFHYCVLDIAPYVEQ